MKGKSHIYHCKYKIVLERGEFKKEDADTDDCGLTDAFMLVSILRDGDKAHEGAVNTAILTFDGQNEGKKILDTELFMVWSNLANILMNSNNVTLWQKEIAKNAFESVKECILMLRELKGDYHEGQ